jgi:hypothetical protein
LQAATQCCVQSKADTTDQKFTPTMICQATQIIIGKSKLVFPVIDGVVRDRCGFLEMTAA